MPAYTDRSTQSGIINMIPQFHKNAKNGKNAKNARRTKNVKKANLAKKTKKGNNRVKKPKTAKKCNITLVYVGQQVERRAVMARWISPTYHHT